VMHSRYKKNIRVVSVVVMRVTDTKGVQEVDIGMVMIEDMAEGEVDPTLVSIVDKLVMYNGFVLNHV
jgi:hypothetical protein